MAYTPTGKPVGRPKTKDYKTISLKMPQDLFDRVQAYARLHRQSLSELIRDGVEWRITDGDPRSLGVSAPQRDADEYSRNTVIPDEVRGEPEQAGMLQEIRTALARQQTQLHALTQALEQRAVVPTLGEYSRNTTHTHRGQDSTLQPAREGTGGPAPQEAHVACGNTVLQEDVPAFDQAKYTLGDLCAHRHDYYGSGQSLRRLADRECLECQAARARSARQRKRQAQPA